MTSALDWITRLVSLDTTSRGSNLELIALVAEELQRYCVTPIILPNADGTKANLVVTATWSLSTAKTGTRTRSRHRSGTAGSTVAAPAT